MHHTQSNPICLDELLARCMGEQDFAMGILQSFLETCDRQLKDMRDQAKSGNHNQLCRLAHRLKGTAATVAARPLRDRLVTLESHSRSKQLEMDSQPDQEIEKMIADMFIELERLRTFLSSNTSK